MSITTACSAASLPSSHPDFRVGTDLEANGDDAAVAISDSNSIVELWLCKIFSPELQQKDNEKTVGDNALNDNGDPSNRTSSSSTDQNDVPLEIPGSDLPISDDSGCIETSPNEVIPSSTDDRSEADKDELKCVTATELPLSLETDYNNANDANRSSSSESEDLVVQPCILESVTPANEKHEQSDLNSSVPSAVSATQIVENPSALIFEPYEALLKLNWADIALEEDEEESTTEDEAQQSGTVAFKLRLPKFSPKDDVSVAGFFDCFWTAWYDPPKGRTAKMGIASDAYEKKLFEIGVIQCLDDFWNIHDVVDWENMPVGSMLSFSRVGAKPFWEDPMHCQGGRWIIRGFPRTKSEILFTKVVLSLFSDHFLDNHQFTCVTLQIKEKRRSNAIQLWTRTPNCQHIAEVKDHIFQLADSWNSGGEKSSRQKSRRRNRGKSPNRNNPASRLKDLQFEFCSNMDSIQRNAIKLGETTMPETTGTGMHCPKDFQLTVASRCNEVAKMCRAGRNRRRLGKAAAQDRARKFDGRQNGGQNGNQNGRHNGKVDWSDSLTGPMGYTKGYSKHPPFAECHGSYDSPQTTTSASSAMSGYRHRASVEMAHQGHQDVTPLSSAVPGNVAGNVAGNVTPEKNPRDMVANVTNRAFGDGHEHRQGTSLPTEFFKNGHTMVEAKKTNAIEKNGRSSSTDTRNTATTTRGKRYPVFNNRDEGCEIRSGEPPVQWDNQHPRQHARQNGRQNGRRASTYLLKLIGANHLTHDDDEDTTDEGVDSNLVGLNSWNQQNVNQHTIHVNRTHIEAGSPPTFPSTQLVLHDQAPYYVDPGYYQQYKGSSIVTSNPPTSSCGVFDEHGCWYPPQGAMPGQHLAPAQHQYSDVSRSDSCYTEGFCQAAPVHFSTSSSSADMGLLSASSSSSTMESQMSFSSTVQTDNVLSQDSITVFPEMTNSNSFAASFTIPEEGPDHHGWVGGAGPVQGVSDNNSCYSGVKYYCDPQEWHQQLPQQQHQQLYGPVESPMGLVAVAPPYYSTCMPQQWTPTTAYENYPRLYNCYYNPQDNSYAYVLAKEAPVHHGMYYSHSTEISRLADSVADDTTTKT